ncbi:hypothetical protein HK405_010770, partial [Cladochytrium tenue]
YTDDNQTIPRNTSILVQRNPPKRPGRGTAQLYLGVAPVATSSAGNTGPTSSSGPIGGRSFTGGGRGGYFGGSRIPGRNNPNQPGGAQSQSATEPAPPPPAPLVSTPLDLEGMTEDQKIEAMLASQSQQWEDEQRQRP